MPARTALAAVLLAFAPLAAAQTEPVRGASIGTESAAPAPSSSSDSSVFPTFSAASVGSAKLEPETCVIRPVMSDAQLKLCGAMPPVYPPKKLVTDIAK